MDAAGNTNPPPPEKEILLYSYWQSSCSWRVRFALKLKGISYQYRAVDLAKREQFSPGQSIVTSSLVEERWKETKHYITEFQKLNPLGYVPVLVDGGVVISDSLAILLYMEGEYPETPLLPEDPQLRALNLQAAGVVSSSIQPLHMQSLLNYIGEKFGPEERSLWAKTHVGKGLLALERLLKGFAGRYATGDSLYMADVFLAPQIAVAVNRFNIDMTEYPTLNRIHESYKALPEFLASAPEAQPDAVL